jgi:hypothetical protein
MTGFSSGDNELVIPPAFRQQVTSALGERRAEIVLGLAEWMVTEHPGGLAASHWRLNVEPVLVLGSVNYW